MANTTGEFPKATHTLATLDAYIKEVGGTGDVVPLYSDEALEFFERADVTDTTAKGQINAFISGCQTLDIWDNLIFVTCRDGLGGLHQMGGSALRTDDEWTLAGDAAMTAFGTNGTGLDALSGTDRTPNRIEPTGVGFSTENSPQMHGVIWSQDYQDTVHASRATIRYATLRHSTVGGTFSGGPSGGVLKGNNAKSNFLLTQSTPDCLTNRDRPVLIAAVNGGHAAGHRNIVNGHYATDAVEQGELDMSLKFCFAFPAEVDGDGKIANIHGIFYWFGEPETLGSDVWTRFYPLLGSTLYNDMRSEGFVRAQLGGQSNASDKMRTSLTTDVFCQNDDGPSECWIASKGGVPLRYWTKDAPYSRSNATWTGTEYPGQTEPDQGYEEHFWSAASDGSGTLEKSRPLSGVGTWVDEIVWFQGESDSEQQALVDEYQARMEAMIGWWREDTGNPSLKVTMCLIDYDIAYRTNPATGGGSDPGVTVSGFTGTGADCNEDYTMTISADENANYDWTGDTNISIIERNVAESRWEIQLADTTVVAYSNDNPAHPQLVTGWTIDLAGEEGTPSIDTSRTGRIEGVRAAQQAVADGDPLVTAVDSRGFDRYDSVHLSTDASSPSGTGTADFAAEVKSVLGY